jgi:hypothetical protein
VPIWYPHVNVSNQSNANSPEIQLHLVDSLTLSDADLLSRLDNLEDSFVERKTEGDSSDWLKTVVGFANTVPIGYPAVLFIGVKNDGTIQGLTNPDSVQKSLSNKIANAYPLPYYWTKVLRRDGRSFMAVIIPGSDRRPHFAGPAYIRDGSQTLVASSEQFDRLLAQRNSKTYAILQWKGKDITIVGPPVDARGFFQGDPRHVFSPRVDGTVQNCNQFYATVKRTSEGNSHSYPLDTIDISFDHEKARLLLRVTR